MMDTDLRLKPLGDRFWLGVLYGLMMGVAYAILGTSCVAVGLGRSVKDVPLLTLIALYLGGGLICGMVLGILAPIARTRTGAMLVGVLAALPCAWLLGKVLPSSATPHETLIADLVWAILMGAGFGWRLWEPVELQAKKLK